jgi:hypothetical protein
VIELSDGQEAFAFGRTVQAFIVIDRLECAVIIPRRILPDDVVPGGVIRASFRKQAGTMYTRTLVLRALNEVNGAISCATADEAGIGPADWVLKVTTERQGGS